MLTRAALCCNSPSWGSLMSQPPSLPKVSPQIHNMADYPTSPQVFITCHIGQLRGLQAIWGLPVLLSRCILLSLRPENGKAALSNTAGKAQPHSPHPGHPLNLPHWSVHEDRGSNRAARIKLAQPGHAHHCFSQFFPRSASSVLVQ